MDIPIRPERKKYIDLFDLEDEIKTVKDLYDRYPDWDLFIWAGDKYGESNECNISKECLTIKEYHKKMTEYEEKMKEYHMWSQKQEYEKLKRKFENE